MRRIFHFTHFYDVKFKNIGIHRRLSNFLNLFCFEVSQNALNDVNLFAINEMNQLKLIFICM